jgi:hypothetical protein
MKITRSATAITIFTIHGSRNETRPAPLALSSLVFIAAAGFCAWKLLPIENGDELLDQSDYAL